MAYSSYSLDGARRAFSLAVREEEDLYGPLPEIAVSPILRAILDENVPPAVDVNTEKMRSEFIIAPILSEVRRLTNRRVSVFSGIEFNVSADEGLSGYCDFILARSPSQLILSAPVLAIVEAKNEDIKGGLGQCAAEMVAARVFNEREGQGPTTIHGAVTTGTNWRFLKLESNNLLVSRQEYFLEPVGRILAILLHCVGGDPATAGAAA